jgi:hypothetical protein
LTTARQELAELLRTEYIIAVENAPDVAVVRRISVDDDIADKAFI